MWSRGDRKRRAHYKRTGNHGNPLAKSQLQWPEIIDDAVNGDQDVAVKIEDVRAAHRAERVEVVWKFV